LSWTACHSGAADKAAAGADCGSGSGFAGSSADCSAQRGTHNGPNRRAADKILIDDFIRRHLNLLHGPLPADRVIGLESLKRLARLWQHHDTWTCWDGRTTAQHCRSETDYKTSFQFHAAMTSSMDWAG
jgi:hypothetical protein